MSETIRPRVPAGQSATSRSLLRSALRPIEPPESLPGRVEETLSAVTEAAAEELSAWAEELSESELPRCATRATGSGRRGRGGRRRRRRRPAADRGAAPASPQRALGARRAAALPDPLAPPNAARPP